MRSRRSDQKNHLRDKLKIHDSNSSSSVYVARYHDNDTIEGNHLKLCKYRIDMLTATLENLQIQNERLQQELMKCQEKTVNNKAFRLQSRVRQLTAQAQTQSFACKVQMLKKTITKLRKLNDTIKHVYEKKLQHIIRVMKIYSF